MKLLLFDIDGTLIKPRGSGQRAADRAFEKIYGIKNVMDGISTDGLTDPLILNDMFNKSFKRKYRLDEAEVFYKEYVYYLEDELKVLNDLTPLPGVFEVLNYLHERKDCLLGVGTGNIEEGAWLKLKYAGLKKFFSFGGFGSDSEDRAELLNIAIDRGKKYIEKNKFVFEDVFVVGDTPKDIVHGKAVGAKTVAVSTGLYNFESLKNFVPDFLAESFKDFDFCFFGIT